MNNGHENSGDNRQDITIKVYNEDTGRSYEIHAGPGTPVRTYIERFYSDAKINRQQDDRLRCDGTGENVFPFDGLHMGDYLKEGHCPDRTWVFAGGTGGAAC